MPERIPYDEAMMFSSIRLKIPDLELKEGQVEKVTIQTKAGPVVRPWGTEGGFAVVYKFRTKSGQFRALRCFRVPMNPDTQFRYERIGKYFQAHARDITANFKYHDTGIVVKETGKQNQAYPVIEMDWIDGLTLVEKVDELCKGRDRATLKNLGEQWLNILRTLQQARIAHGDLAGVNVMLRSDGRLVLIDYDGVYIPDFANLPQVLLGQVDYQHPDMSQRKFNEHMDDFSALVIYTALLALEVRPELWDNYAKRDQQRKLLDTNLLFTQQDFKDPQQSALMRELEQLGDQRVKAAAQELKRLCLQTIDQARFPFQLIDPNYNKKLALEQLAQAVKAGNDELIAASWLPILDGYPPAQMYRNRVSEAQLRVRALQRFHAAIQGHSIQHIVAGYDPVLDSCNNVTQDERSLLATARRFLQAYQSGNDDDLLALADSLQNIHAHKGVVFTAQEQQRIASARQRKLALQQLRDALVGRSIEVIAAAYNPGQNTYNGLSHDERQQAEAAIAFVQAYRSDDDRTIIAAFDATNSLYQGFFVFTAQQQQRLALARQRMEALAKFRDALSSRSPRRIAAIYDPVLDSSRQITQEERYQLALASSFTRAYDGNDEIALVAACDAIQSGRPPGSPLPPRAGASPALGGAFFTFTVEEQQRIARARKHNQALVEFRDALKSKRPDVIVAAYAPLLDTSRHVTQGERHQLALARSFLQAYAGDDDEELIAVVNADQAQKMLIFTFQEQQRITLATRRHAALLTFQKAWRDSFRNAQRLVNAYDASLLDASRNVTAEQRARVETARNYLHMRRDIQAGIKADNDDLILTAYNKALDQQFEGFTQEERDRINKIMKSLELQELLRNREDERAILMARNLARSAAKAVADNLFQLQRAMRRFIREHDLTELQVHIEENRARGENEALVRWLWPSTELVKEGLIAWRTDTWPQRPKERGWGERAQPKSGPDVEWHYEEVQRKNNQTQGEHRFPIGHHNHIYVRAFACIRDDWDRRDDLGQEHIILRYSDGLEPTSQAEAASPHTLWRNYG